MDNKNQNRQNQRPVRSGQQNAVKNQQQKKSNKPPLATKQNNRSVTVAGTQAVVRVGSPRVHTIKKQTQSKPLPVGMVFLAVVCTFLVLFMIMNFMQINEYNQDLRRMNSSISELEARESQLSIDAGRGIDWAELQELALSLGMTSAENLLPPIQITSEVEDEVRNYETDDNDANIVSTVLTALGNNISSFWNIFAGGE